MREIVFLCEEAPEGGYTARVVGASIFTEADDAADLREMIRDAVRCQFPDEARRPRSSHLHRVRDEVLTP